MAKSPSFLLGPRGPPGERRKGTSPSLFWAAPAACGRDRQTLPVAPPAPRGHTRADCRHGMHGRQKPTEGGTCPHRGPASSLQTQESLLRPLP